MYFNVPRSHFRGSHVFAFWFANFAATTSVVCKKICISLFLFLHLTNLFHHEDLIYLTIAGKLGKCIWISVKTRKFILIVSYGKYYPKM